MDDRDPAFLGWFVRVSEHAWEEIGRDGQVLATHWTTTKRDRNQQTTLETTEESTTTP